MTDLKACRESFEKWATTQGFAVEYGGDYEQHGGEYTTYDTSCAWDGWQAAWNTRPAAEGEAVANTHQFPRAIRTGVDVSKDRVSVTVRMGPKIIYNEIHAIPTNFTRTPSVEVETLKELAEGWRSGNPILMNWHAAQCADELEAAVTTLVETHHDDEV